MRVPVFRKVPCFVDRFGPLRYFAIKCRIAMEPVTSTGCGMSLTFFNRDARVLHDSEEFRFSEEDFEQLNSPSNYWHHRTDPSSWLCASTVLHAKIRFRGRLPRAKLIKLCAETLNITEQKLEDTLDWNANYMSFHDGGTAEENHVYPMDINPGER